MQAAFVTAIFALAICALTAQDRLRSMSGYDQYQKMAPQIVGSWVSGAIVPRWDSDGRSFSYSFAGKAYRFDLATMSAAESDEIVGIGGRGARGGQTPASGQQPPATGRGSVPQNGGQT